MTPDSITPDSLRDWLDQAGKDRYWLAERCGTHKTTVDGWFSAKSNRPIPGPARIIIAQLMDPGSPITPTLDYPTWKRLEAKAHHRQQSLDAFVADVLRREAARTDEETAALYGPTALPPAAQQG